jgi:hypothetical protein
MIDVQTIIDRARQASDYVGNSHVQDSEATSQLDGLWAQHYGDYTAAYPELYRVEATVISDGTADYALPADYFGTIGMDWEESVGGRRTELRRLQEHERNRFAGLTGTHHSTHFRVIGGNLYLYPTPTSGQRYIHIYIPVPTRLDAVSDQIDGLLGHERLFVIELAKFILMKCQKYDGRFEVEIRELVAKLKQEAAMRQLVEPQTCEDPLSPWDRYDWAWQTRY